MIGLATLAKGAGKLLKGGLKRGLRAASVAMPIASGGMGIANMSQMAGAMGGAPQPMAMQPPTDPLNTNAFMPSKRQARF